MKTRIHVFISGSVQGVFFRSNTKWVADTLGIKGWVRNLSDGRVEIVAEGEKTEELVSWVREGPSVARVDKVDLEYMDYVGEFNSFGIRY